MSTDTSFEEGKVAIREWVVGQVGNPLRVLDLYCGREGLMYQRCWHKADRYFGVDKAEPHRLGPTAQMTAERAASALDMDDWNLFDLDCYASPWVVARRIIRRRGLGRFGMALTSGETQGLMNGKGNEILRATLGIRGLSDTRLFGRYSEDVMMLMVRSLGEIPGVTLGEKMLFTGKRTGAYFVYYLGLVLDRTEKLPYTVSGDRRPQGTGGRDYASNAVRAGSHRRGYVVRREDRL